LLRPKEESHGPLRKFFDWFNRVFARATETYVRWSGVLIRKSAIALVLLAVFAVAAIFFSNRVPGSFLPDEDQGYFFVNLQLPDSASLQRTTRLRKKVETILSRSPGVQYTTSVVGFSLLSFVRTTYNAFFFVTLNPWEDRKTRAAQYQEIKARLNQELSRIPQGVAFDFARRRFPALALRRIHFRARG